MKITDIKATTVTVPLEAPLRHAAGCHWDVLFVRSSRSRPTRESPDLVKWAAEVNRLKLFFVR